MKKQILFYFIIVMYSQNIYCQQKQSKQKFFITTGYGLAGSFFVRSYDEFIPASRYKSFEKKDFLGSAQNIGIGVSLKKNYQFVLGLNFQHFTRSIKSKDTLGYVEISFDNTIHHRDYIWFAGITKKFEQKNQILSPGIGIFYSRSKQEEVQIIYPNSYLFQERNFKNSRLEEAGVYAELAYEYKFQTKVNLGIKTQFYFTISTGSPESLTLFPFIRITL